MTSKVRAAKGFAALLDLRARSIVEWPALVVCLHQKADDAKGRESDAKNGSAAAEKRATHLAL